MLDYDQVSPFRQVIHHTKRKRQLRAFRRGAFEAGTGLSAVDSSLIWDWATGRLHDTRIWALEARRAADEQFRAYAEPYLELYREWSILPKRALKARHAELLERSRALPKSPRDIRTEA